MSLGIVKADFGMIYVNGKDIRDYLTEVRRSIGYCPAQSSQNLLFKDLNAMEHLLMFGWVKINKILLFISPI